MDEGKNDSKQEEEEEELVFEDPYEDEFEEEDEEDYVENDDDEEGEGDQGMEVDGDDDEEQKGPKLDLENWVPTVDRKRDANGEIEFDSTAYEMFHSMNVEWPCLSFDVIPDRLGMKRTRFPMTGLFVAGTQAEKPEDNRILLLKMSQLSKMKNDLDSEDESDSETEDDPELEMRQVNHNGGVNRIRCMPQEPNYVAAWSDQGSVSIWDFSMQINSLFQPTGQKFKKTPLTTLKYKTEGFALDWSPVKAGRLITGDCDGGIYLTDLEGTRNFNQNPKPFTGHKGSVEDLQFSPSEETVFASCGVDKTIKIWDTRQSNQTAAKSWVAGSSDINVLSWGKKVVYLMVSGCDDGSFAIWDLRSLKSGNNCSTIAHFKWHTKPITSVAWDPNDESVLAVASEDDQLTMWDLSTERDESEAQAKELSDIPPQLLFIHQNQTDIKEIRFHSQLPGVITSTASEGFDIFKPNVTVRDEDE